MIRPAKIRARPPSVRQWLNDQLYLNGFCDYLALEGELKDMGYAVSRSAVHRWGQALKKQMDTAEAVRLLNLGRKTAP